MAPARGALLAVVLVVVCVTNQGRAATDQSYWEQQAAAVKAACSLSSFYGEDFYMGARLLSTRMANSVGACCAQCDANPSCDRWTHCPLTQLNGCQVPLGPFINSTVPAGTCILSNSIPPSNPNVWLSWSYMQPGVVWASGRKSTAETVQAITTAASYQDNREFINTRMDAFFCRKITAGNLQLTALTGSASTGLPVAVGDQVAYTGVTVLDQQSAKWGIVYSNATKSYWRYPAAYLGPCDDSQAGPACTSSPSGGRNEEGTSCEQDDDCCSGMICMPRVAYNPSTVADVALVTNPTSPTQADLRLFNVAPPGKADGLSVLPRECTALARELVWTNWAVSQYNSSAINASASVFCPYLPADLSWGINGTANASAPTNFTEADPVPWETWASQLCEDLSAAGQKLSEAFKKGGLAAARAFNASLYTCPPNGPNLLTLFYNSINPPFTGGWDSVVDYAKAYAAAADSTGSAMCVGLATVAQNGTILQQLQVHTPYNASSEQPVEPHGQEQGSSSSNTGVIVGVVVAVVAACAVGALLAFYIVRRRRRQRLADAERMAVGDVDDFLDTRSFPGKPVEGAAVAAAAAGTAGGLGSYPDGSMGPPPGTPSPVTTSGTSAAAGASSGHASIPPTRSKDWVLSAITTTRVQRSARLSGGSGSEGAATVSPRRGSSGLDARPWEIAFEELHIVRSCGEGSYGKVYMGTWHETDVAIKILLGTTMVNSQQEAEEALEESRKMVGQLDDEAGLMASLRHPNCVPFFAVCHNPPCIVTEYCSRGGLDSVLAEARRDPAALAKMTWKRRLSLVLDAARGMLYLHRRSVPVLHRDLKSPNILVDENWHAKVGDFNLSRLMEDPKRTSSLAAMNPRWLAPEVMQGAHASKASDVYSFGIVLWEVLTLQLPFASGTQGPWQLVGFVMHGGRPEVPPLGQLPGADTPQFEGLGAYIGLMQRCWAQDPEARPDFAAIVSELKALLTARLGSSDDLMSPTHRRLLSERPSGEGELRTSGGSGGTSGPAAPGVQGSSGSGGGGGGSGVDV